MSSDEKKIKFKNEMGKQEVIVYMETLLDGLKRGNLQLQQGADSLVLTPSSVMKVEMKATQKKKKGSLRFKISWKEEGADNDLSASRSSSPSADEDDAAKDVIRIGPQRVDDANASAQ